MTSQPLGLPEALRAFVQQLPLSWFGDGPDEAWSKMHVADLLARLDVFAREWDKALEDRLLQRWTVRQLEHDAQLAAVVAERDALKQTAPPPMFAALLLKLKEECESQHAQVVALTAERDALKAHLQTKDDEIWQVWVPIADGIHHDHRCERNVATGGRPDWICLRCQLEDAQAERDVLKVERDTAYEYLEHVLTETPLPNGNYVHRPVCNGDRTQPPGTRGTTCNCLPSKQAGDTARAALREALDKYGSHKNRCYALDPFRCSCGFDQALAASTPERKETNPCPVCGTFLWGDTRPCWNCARAASAPERTTLQAGQYLTINGTRLQVTEHGSVILRAAERTTS